MKTAYNIAFLVFGFLLFSTVHAQDETGHVDDESIVENPSLIIGITSGYGRVFHTEGIALQTEAAETNSFLFGGFLELFLPNRSTSIAIRTFYNDMATTTSSVAGQPYTIVGRDGTPVTTEVRHTSDFTASFIHGEVVALQNVFDNFSLGFGVGAGFPQEGRIVNRFELVAPADAQFVRDPDAESKGLKYSDDNRTIFFKNNDVVNTHYYVKLGARYSWTLANIFITPSIFYNFGLNTATQKEDFKMNTLQLGVDLGFGL